MPYQANVTQIQQVNSTTYADELGLLLGLDRLEGEAADYYIRRLEFAARLRREHPYEGALNEMSLQLGFIPQAYLTAAVGSSEVIKVSIAGVVIGSHPTIPILTFDNDTMWRWRLLSDVVTDMNLYAPTELLVDDGPALQLARQSNSLWAFAEDTTGLYTQLLHPGVQLGSELFSQSVPEYVLTHSGLLTFATEPVVGTKITYNYIVSPYDVVGSPVAMIGFKDPELTSVATTPDGSLAYQLREFIQSIMLVDRSYWAK